MARRAEALDFLEERIRENLEAMLEDGRFLGSDRPRLEAVALEVTKRLSRRDLEELGRLLSGEEAPWTSSSGSALQSGIAGVRLQWSRQHGKEPPFVDTPAGRVAADAELQRLLECFRRWDGGQDTEDG